MPVQRIKNLEKQRGNLHDVIPNLVKQHGQVGAGQKLGVSAATINRWLKGHGYVYRRVSDYVREEEAR